MRIAIALALIMLTGPAFADDALAPTEGGEQAGNEAAPDPGPAGCHRCVDNSDGGSSDSGYSNPSGAWTNEAGDTMYDPGHSQDWYNDTGPYGPDQPSTAPSRASADQSGPSNGARRNGGGHDR